MGRQKATTCPNPAPEPRPFRYSLTTPSTTSAKLARYTGCAPIPVYSADQERFRLHQGGNRRLNSVLYTAAIVQKRPASSRTSTPGTPRTRQGLTRGTPHPQTPPRRRHPPSNDHRPHGLAPPRHPLSAYRLT
ncbi:transposase [Actinosynnema sp. NPDC091369]